MPMPNRNIEGNYRYGYQGQYAEKEPEIGSGINSFKLRLYDSRIGRWISPDPYSQFHSPYLAMNNNPISFADSDGGCTTKGGRPCAFSVMGGTATDAGGNVWSGTGDTASALHTPFQLDEFTIVGTKPNWLKSLAKDNALKRLAQDNALKRTFAEASEIMSALRANNAEIMRERVGSVYKVGAEYGLMGSGLYSGLGLGTRNSRYLYHYTSPEAAKSIAQTGLKVGRDGFSYLTDIKNLKPLQAQIELALPVNRSLPTSILRINTSELTPVITRRVQGNLHGLGAGGGTEFLFNQTIPASAIKIIK